MRARNPNGSIERKTAAITGAALSMVAVFAIAGCDDSGSGPTPPVDGGGGVDAGSCLAETDVCTDDADCCSLDCYAGQCVPPFTGAPLSASCGDSASCNSGNCNTESAICVAPAGECSAAEDACQFGWECCSGNCGGGICTDPEGSCHSLGVACVTDGNCCWGKCQALVCVVQLTAVGDPGDPCEHDDECSSNTCLSGKCVADSCDDEGTSCTPGVDDGTCCSGACSEVTGECTAVPICVDAGEACGAHWECCSALCSPYSGRCEPPAPPPT